MQSVLLVAVMQQGGGSTQFIQLPAATHPPYALLAARWHAQPLLHLAAAHAVCLNAAIGNVSDSPDARQLHSFKRDEFICTTGLWCAKPSRWL
jgi:hypothetical protein